MVVLFFGYMPISVTPLTIEDLKAKWPSYQQSLQAPFPFVMPQWLEAWWANFGRNDGLRLFSVESDGQPIGIAPLRVREGVARFIGSADVCDYLDFIVKPGAESSFFAAVINDLKAGEVKMLELESLRPDSMVIKHLLPAARSIGFAIETADTDVTLEMPLPNTWDEYLAGLSTHQRHEIGRKGRRLVEVGDITFDIKPPENVESELSTLIQLLRISRADKAEFMTTQMELFFRQLAAAMHEAGLLRFGRLSLNGVAVASIMCFDYNGTRYLYNSGYQPQYSSLSVGLLSKVFSIKDAIEHELTIYDYLKGAEVYKYHLGGFELPITSAIIRIV